MAQRADYPVPSLVLALSLAGTEIDPETLERAVPPGSRVGVFPEWLLLSVPGPFADERGVLRTGRDALLAALHAAEERTLPFRRDVRSGVITVCDALAQLGEPCPEGVLRRRPPAAG
jgi:hypothetical protein